MNWFSRLLGIHWNPHWTKGFPSSFSSFTSSDSWFYLSKFSKLTFLFLMIWVGKNWATLKHWEVCPGSQWKNPLDWPCTRFIFEKSLEYVLVSRWKGDYIFEMKTLSGIFRFTSKQWCHFKGDTEGHGIKGSLEVGTDLWAWQLVFYLLLLYMISLGDPMHNPRLQLLLEVRSLPNLYLQSRTFFQIPD